MRTALIALLVSAACAQPGPAPAARGNESQSHFWAWFRTHQDEVATIRTAREPIADMLHAELHKVDPQLTFELGNDMRPREFIISADGIKASFPAVQALAAAAPQIADWKVIAFRQRHPGHDRVQLDGFLLKADDIAYLAAPTDGHKLDLDIYVKAATGITRQVRHAAYLLLDSVLGEFDVEMRLAGIRMTAGPFPPDAQPLRELPKRVDALKESMR
jgi:hypothetical protein